MGDLSKNFFRKEFACQCGCGFDSPEPLLVESLQTIRDFFGKAVKVHSACRCKDHNKNVKGRPNSQHLVGWAADISIEGVPLKKIARFAAENVEAFAHGGIGLYKNFVHLDVRESGPARWGLKWKEK